ncbi:MAG: zinc dependent phospholipase C family protein [Oscillospiraceae bacterium]|nr:zinc dependent phospholipase C family protein [Oscillospiraceae bacterium]
MPDNYAHKYNGQQALKLADYTPRNYEAFILGCNGPDPLYCYQMYETKRRHNLYDLADRMHRERTGLFLQNLFTLAQTNAQKDYCLGFLCHYALDSVMHPYINYITTAYASPFNRENGHQWFESALDSAIAFHETGSRAANPAEYCPYTRRMYIEQIVTLFKQAVEATYEDVHYDRNEYTTAFHDFRKVKNWLYSPTENKAFIARPTEMLLGLEKGMVASRIQPCKLEITDVAVWRDNVTGFFRTDTIQDLMHRANQMAADYINVGLSFFHGTYNVYDLLEDIGNKSYLTGFALEE